MNSIARPIHITSIVGARPQFIKSGVVSRALRRAGLSETLVHTGQHYDFNMSDVFFRELDIPMPDHHLDIGSATHGSQTGRMLEKIEQLLLHDCPDWVVVYGDTNSTLAGVLAACKLHIPVAHVEAGLRSFNRRMPEEINRVVADHVSELLFAPTVIATENLLHEGIVRERIRLVGDVMFDAALSYGQRAECRSQILNDLGLTNDEFLLATIHRAENTDDPTRLQIIWEALETLTHELRVVVPLHPRTRKVLDQLGLLQRPAKRFVVIDPVGYLDMVMLERHARLVVTDSGGVQKEAYFHNVPCVTLRDETEWTELVDAGWNRLAPPYDVELIIAAVHVGLADKPEHHPEFYGDGHTGERICDALLGVGCSSVTCA